MRSVLRLLVLVGMLLALGVAPAQAQQTLDQQQTQGSIFGRVAAQGFSAAQTFTAGLTGSLTQVDLLLFRNGAVTQPLTVEIRNTVGGVPGNVVLATATLAPADVPGTDFPTATFVPVTFSPGAPVVAGTQYAIVLYSTANFPSNYYGWILGPEPNPYPAGAHFASFATPPGAFVPLPGGPTDFAFRTYVTVAAYAAAFSVERLAVSGRTVSFRIIGPAKVRFTLDRRVAPRRYRRVGSFVRKARRGRNRVRIPGRLNGRRVTKGVYRLSARSVGGGMPSGPLERRIIKVR